MKPRKNPLLKSGLKTINPDQFDSPHVFDERPGMTKPELRRLMRKQTAAEFIGKMAPGIHIFGVSKGQFILIDIQEELDQKIFDTNKDKEFYIDMIEAEQVKKAAEVLDKVALSMVAVIQELDKLGSPEMRGLYNKPVDKK